MRSRSPTRWNCSSTTSRSSVSRKNESTTSSLLLIALASRRGKTIHRFSRRAPIGVTVLSITSSSDAPSSCMGRSSSSERMVKRSRRT